MSKSSFQLVNPYIKGKFDKNFTAGSARTAASKVWQSLSQYFSGPLKRYHFTIQSAGGKLYHFEVKEKISKKHIDFSLREINGGNKKQLGQFKSTLARFIQKTGGADDKKKKDKDDKDDDDSDSSSDSSGSSSSSNSLYSSLIPRFSISDSPILHYWYNPSIYDVSNIFVPTFISPLSPIVQLTYDWIPVLV